MNDDPLFKVYGSADGWLKLDLEGASPMYLAPAQVEPPLTFTKRPFESAWNYLGEFRMVEPTHGKVGVQDDKTPLGSTGKCTSLVSVN